LGSPFLEILDDVRQSYQFVVAAFVVMPGHFHLLVSEPERDDLSQAMQGLKAGPLASRVSNWETASIFPLLGGAAVSPLR